MEGRRCHLELTLIAAGLGLVFVAALAGLMVFGGDSPSPVSDLWPLSFFLLWATPALVALLSVRSRPVLLVPAAVLSFFLSFLSLARVLLVPTVLYVIAYRRRPWPPVRLVPALLAVVMPVVFTAAALVVLLIGPDPVCWAWVEDRRGERTYSVEAGDGCDPGRPQLLVGPPEEPRASGGGATSDVVTPGEAAASAGLIATGLAGGWLLAAQPPKV